MHGKTAKCEHKDCFTCPYPDCISNKEPVKRKRGRKRLAPEEKRRHRREQQRNYVDRHREQVNESQREYYKRKKAQSKQQATEGGR